MEKSESSKRLLSSLPHMVKNEFHLAPAGQKFWAAESASVPNVPQIPIFHNSVFLWSTCVSQYWRLNAKQWNGTFCAHKHVYMYTFHIPSIRHRNHPTHLHARLLGKETRWERTRVLKLLELAYHSFANVENVLCTFVSDLVWPEQRETARNCDLMLAIRKTRRNSLVCEPTVIYGGVRKQLRMGRPTAPTPFLC